MLNNIESLFGTMRRETLFALNKYIRGRENENIFHLRTMRLSDFERDLLSLMYILMFRTTKCRFHKELSAIFEEIKSTKKILVMGYKIKLKNYI